MNGATRTAQEASVADVERQLAAGEPVILIGDVHFSPEAAWASAAGLRRAWAIADDEPELAVSFDSVEKDPLGVWHVLVERRQHGGPIVSLDRLELGRFEP